MGQRIWAVALSMLAFAACSSGEGSAPASGGSAGTGASAGSGGGGGSGGSPGGACPAAAPTNGSGCTLVASAQVRAHCTYGDDPRPACRTTALCASDGSWKVTPPASSCSTPPLPAACPTQPATAGTTCNDTALSCWYPDGARCWCSECQGGSPYPVCQTIDPPQWACATPPSGCPPTVPQAGTACSTEGASCGPDCELRVTCEGGVWQWQHGDCPICASPDTPIATPSGERPIANLREGDLVYSVDGAAIVVVPLLRVASTPVGGHRVVRVTLDDARVLELSAGHPTADGRTFGELRSGVRLDDARTVRLVEVVPYAHPRTYDILPASSTGAYFAAGALVGSTLRPQP